MQQSIFSNRENQVNQGKMMNRIIKNPIEKKLRLFLPVIIWLSGLILAGSEGMFMPYLNIAGGVMFFAASVWLGKVLPCQEPDAELKKNSRKTVEHPAPIQDRLVFCCHDHGCA